jgi:predicted metal-dependent phosphotriesterase family hydrolase
MPRIARTVLGDVDPAQLGPTDAHEHLFFVTPLQPGEEFSSQPALGRSSTGRRSGSGATPRASAPSPRRQVST